MLTFTWVAGAAAQSNPGTVGLNKASQNPIVIRGQLDLGALYARQALDRLRAAPSTETFETLQQTIVDSYVQLRYAHTGLSLKRQAAKMSRFSNPVVDMAYDELEKAMVNIRNAWEISKSLSPDRPDIAQEVMRRLEAVILTVADVEDLI
jgi:hypothetical protein